MKTFYIEQKATSHVTWGWAVDAESFESAVKQIHDGLESCLEEFPQIGDACGCHCSPLYEIFKP